MHICLICVEIFAWGKYGGFGRATRIIGRELAKRGVQVTAVIPRRPGQGFVEVLDGIRVLSFRPFDFAGARALYREVNADIYHSEEPSLGTYFAMRAASHGKHVVTFRDPRTMADWLVELRFPSLSRFQVLANWIYEDNPLVHWAVRRADGHFAAAHLIIEKAKKKYGLPTAPKFLPTPVEIPEKIEKAKEPTVCFISRWDKRKRPELFFELARSFPEVRFIAVGKGRDPDYENRLRKTYGGLPNVEMVGFIDQFRSNALSQILAKSWILVNTAAREGLPNTFIEACAHGCAILSAVNPDNFASRFGYWVRDGNFNKGLAYLLESERWKGLGDEGLAHVRETFSLERAIDRHLQVYERILGLLSP